MGVEIEGVVGPQENAAGSRKPLRQSIRGGLCISQERSAFAEISARGELFIVSTPTSGVAHGTALSTTPPLALWNPPNSGRRGILITSTFGYVSGTLGSGTIVYARVPYQSTAPTGGTELVPVCANLTDMRGILRAFQSSTLAATPTIVRSAFVIGGTIPSMVVKDELNGEIVVDPGTVLALQGVATAGTSPLVLLGLSYHEEPFLR